MTTENNRKKKGILLYRYAMQQASNKRQMGKASTADFYRVAASHLFAFLGNKDILAGDLTPTLVNDLQAYLQAKRLKINSINSYLSSLRAINNATFVDKVRLTHKQIRG